MTEREDLQYRVRKQKAVGGVSRVEWCDTLLKQATIPTSSTVPVGTCSINCCLHRACRLHTLSTACIKETTRWTLWNFYSMFSLLFPFPSLSSFSYSPPSPLLLFFLSSATKQIRKTSLPCFAPQLPSCPEALEYLVSSHREHLSSICQEQRNLIGGNERETKKEEKGRLHQEVWWVSLCTEVGEKCYII